MWLDTSIAVHGQPVFAYIRDGTVHALDICRSPSPHLPPQADMAILARLSHQLGQYLAGTRQGFDLPVAPPPTPWRTRVFSALAAVPYGKTISYAHLAAMAGNPRAARAVASALATNPLPLLRACHRVVPARSPDPGKYCWGAATKATLLEMEARNA